MSAPFTPPAVHCMECARWSLRDGGELAQHGFGACGLWSHYERQWHTLSGCYARYCESFAQAKAETFAARAEWLRTHRPNTQQEETAS